MNCCGSCVGISRSSLKTGLVILRVSLGPRSAREQSAVGLNLELSDLVTGTYLRLFIRH